MRARGLNFLENYYISGNEIEICLFEIIINREGYFWKERLSILFFIFRAMQIFVSKKGKEEKYLISVISIENLLSSVRAFVNAARTKAIHTRRNAYNASTRLMKLLLNRLLNRSMQRNL